MDNPNHLNVYKNEKYEKSNQSNQSKDHTGSIAQAFFIANLLFIGAFYLLLCGLYFLKYQDASEVSKRHLKQTLIASSITTGIVLVLNIIILTTSEYASVTALILGEIYLMLIVPVFLVMGIIGFTKAVQGYNFSFPVIGRLASCGL